MNERMLLMLAAASTLPVVSIQVAPPAKVGGRRPDNISKRR